MHASFCPKKLLLKQNNRHFDRIVKCLNKLRHELDSIWESSNHGHENLNKLNRLKQCFLYFVSECGENEFACHDKTCIDKASVCDGTPDCPDNEDEVECGK